MARSTSSFYGTWGNDIGGGIPRDDPDAIYVPRGYTVTLRLSPGEKITVVTTGKLVKL